MVDDGGYGPLPRRQGSGNALTHILMAVLGAGLAAGLLLAFGNQAQGGSLPGSGAVPAPAAADPPQYARTPGGPGGTPPPWGWPPACPAAWW
jgi:hypothetical protein